LPQRHRYRLTSHRLALNRLRLPRYKRGGGAGGWIVLGIAVLLLAGGGIAVAVNWKRISEAFAASGKGGDEEKPGKKDGKPGKDKGKTKSGGVGKAGFPRRALLITAHNYLYMNPISSAPVAKDKINPLARAFNLGLNIPLDQITELSDAAGQEPRPPLKGVIEEAVQNFLKTSRKQDRVVIVFAGHTAEIEGKAYLVPLEAEKEKADELVPVSWVLDQLAKADVKQKVFILDGHRKNAAQGEERPMSGEMTEGFEKAISAPPAGVQVWAACGKGQVSNEYDDPMGLFLGSLADSLMLKQGERGALEGTIQQPEDAIPLDKLRDAVNRRMAEAPQKPKQESKLFGKEREGGAEYDRSEAKALAPALPVVKGADAKEVRDILAEISLPSLKGGEGAGADLQFGNLPPFPAEVMKKYGGTLEPDSKFRQAVQRARATLWAISRSTAPTELQGEVQAIRAKTKVDLSVLSDRYSKPGGGAAEMAFKNSFNDKSTALARIVATLEDELDQLKEAGKEKKDAPPRWQAHYDYVLARLQAQLAYVEQYNGLFGQMKKELPPSESFHTGWRVASNEKATDAQAKKYEKPARKLYGEVAEGHAKTPWAVLAKREKLTALGMEWQAY
ncbi:MAG: caspase family protein, partial [Gemmataceae bacterium]|nr:caspase family protein [Gemmataceae bacterium]